MLSFLRFFVVFSVFVLLGTGNGVANSSENDKPKEELPGHVVNSESEQQSNKPVKPTENGEKKVVKQPDITFKEPVFNFGKVYRGNKVVHVFKFINTGKDELLIEKVRSSCGCTAAMASSKNIMPGKTGEVKVTFNTQSYKGDVKKQVTVYSNDQDTPKYKLTISGNVAEEVVVKPKRVDFSKVPYGKGFEKKVLVKSGTDLKLKIKKVETSNPNVEVSFKKEKGSNDYFVNVAIKKDTDFGRINGNLFIYTNSKNQKKVIVPFYGEVIGDFSVYPPSVSCGIITKRREMVFPVFAISYKEDVVVERVEIDPTIFDTDIAETKIKSKKSKKSTFKISVILKKDAPVGKIDESLKIYTNSKVQPLIEIPVKGEVREG